VHSVKSKRIGKDFFFKRAVKVGEQPYGIYYTNCVFLNNILIMLQMGSQTNDYFEQTPGVELCLPPDYLEQYCNE
jgi:hypothetical protein